MHPTSTNGRVMDGEKQKEESGDDYQTPLS